VGGGRIRKNQNTTFGTPRAGKLPCQGDQSYGAGAGRPIRKGNGEERLNKRPPARGVQGALGKNERKKGGGITPGGRKSESGEKGPALFAEGKTREGGV